jgi:centrosomal protein CEP44
MQKELQRMSHSPPIDCQKLQQGHPSDLLPILHFSLLLYSKPLYGFLNSKGYDLYSKTDLRFLEAAWKIARQEFAYQPQVGATEIRVLIKRQTRNSYITHFAVAR